MATPNTVNIYSNEFDLERVETPCFLVFENALEKNAAVLDRIQQESGAKVLMALKGFAMFSAFPVLNGTLAGTCASSPHEARLGKELFGGEVHSSAPAYSRKDIAELARYSDYIIFNSFSQWELFKPILSDTAPWINCGIRINPEHSEARAEACNPCTPGSRLGVTLKNFQADKLESISGFHFHTLSENNSDAFSRTLKVVTDKFGQWLKHPSVKWINIGGGQLFTADDYDMDGFLSALNVFKSSYPIDIYLEPGECVALNAGVFVTEVLDIVSNDIQIAILDSSATAHLPNVLESSCPPSILDAGQPGEFPYTYRLAGVSCLAGDIFGDYSFPEPLKRGTRVVFLDMAHYTMVRMNTFNGIKLPSIYLCGSDNKLRLIKCFGYRDFISRLS